MSERAHTPGPWYPGHLGSDSSCQCANVVEEGYAGGICTVHIGNGKRIGDGGNDAPPREQAIANMHLIAAAPEMLAALKLAMPAFNAVERVHQIRAAGYPRKSEEDAALRIIDEFSDICRAAISKAEKGDTP